MPIAIAAHPPATFDRPPATSAPLAGVRQAAYASAEGAAIPEPPPTIAAGPKTPAEAEPGQAKRPESDLHPPGPAPTSGYPPGAPDELPAPAAEGTLTLDEAIAETLQSDPKLKSAVETIRQAQGDFTTSSLLPNPTLQINGDFLPFSHFTPAQPGGPPELDVIASFPIDWWLFGKRAAAMASARLGVSVSNADYCDQVRQRMANTASAYFNVHEAKAMLKLAQEDLASLSRVEQITRAGVRIGGAGTIEAERIRLSVLDAQREVRTREASLKTAKAQFRAAIGRNIAAPDCEVAGSLDVPKPAAPISISRPSRLPNKTGPTSSPCGSRLPRPAAISGWNEPKHGRQLPLRLATSTSIRRTSARRTPLRTRRK